MYNLPQTAIKTDVVIKTKFDDIYLVCNCINAFIWIIIIKNSVILTISKKCVLNYNSDITSSYHSSLHKTQTKRMFF